MLFNYTILENKVLVIKGYFKSFKEIES